MRALITPASQVRRDMFESIRPQNPDKIIMLIKQFRDDPREQKIDLGVGVYRNADGVTPVMKAVKDAEHQLWLEQETKAYTALAGDPGYHAAMRSLVLGDAVDEDRIAALHTPGGTGAVRNAFEVVRLTSPDRTVWVSKPSWPNHLSMLDFLALPRAEYRYFDSETRSVNFAAMMDDLSQAEDGDAIVLHGCCHNPTGADLSSVEWDELGAFLINRGVVPIIDIAYQGFGDGIAEDVIGLRSFAGSFPEMLIAASCSKNFGLYRERTGILLAIARDSRTRNTTQSLLAHLNRQNISFPPDHGSRLVTMILQNDALRTSWQDELNAINATLRDNRARLAEELRRRSSSDRFGFISSHKGMFSLLGASEDQVELMKKRHGIYLVSDSRINVAGLTDGNIPKMAEAMLDVGM